MSDCLFCKIVEGEIPSKKVLETDDLVAFHDVNPQAPVHLLLIPRKHLASLDEVGPEDADLMGKLVAAIPALARDHLNGGSYRVVNNCGADAGQSVFHIHFHILGGRGMGWPPG